MSPLRDEEVLYVEVSAREFPRARWLIDTIELIDEMHQDFKKLRSDVAIAEGVTMEARIDWRQVVNFCAPTVIVVMAHDPTGEEFEDHPLYMVLPDSGQYIPLTGQKVFLSVEESDDEKSEVDVLGALNSLSTYIQTIDGGKKENAVRQLRILQRILK